MKNEFLDRYSEYRIDDVIGRLEGFRGTIGWGELNDDLNIAIECLEYVKEAIKIQDAETASELKQTADETEPHWVVFDHGFAGLYCQCSKCDDGFWPTAVMYKEECPHCNSTMNLDATEYVE